MLTTRMLPWMGSKQHRSSVAVRACRAKVTLPWKELASR